MTRAIQSFHSKCGYMLSAVLAMTFATQVRAGCPIPKAGSTVLTGMQECVIRGENSTTGNYALICKDTQQNGVVSATKFTSSHTAVVGALLNDSVVQNSRAIDGVDIGGAGSLRWLPSWMGHKTNTVYDNVWFGARNANWVQQLLESTFVDPTASERTRWGHALDLLSATRRVVHVESRYVDVPANSCNSLPHKEWRAMLNLRETPTLNVVSGASRTFLGDCSFNQFHQGSAGWGQDMPDVSTSWALADYFVATWYEHAVGCKIFARVFGTNGQPVTNPIEVATFDSACGPNSGVASPRVSATPGGFMVVWTRSDYSLWMRSYDISGNPLIVPRLVTPTNTLLKSMNPDIDVAFVDACGQGAEPYFAISWRDWHASTSEWYPKFIILRDLSNPTPIIPGWGSTTLNSPGEPANDAMWDRVSLTFFNRVNSADSACGDLTLGFGWTVGSDARTQFVKYVPECPQSSGLWGPLDDDLQSLDFDEGRECQPPNCVKFAAGDRPAAEPELRFPDEFDGE